MLAGRDVVGKEGLRTVRTKTFKDWKDEVYKDWKDKDICVFFLLLCSYCYYLAHRSSP